MASLGASAHSDHCTTAIGLAFAVRVISNVDTDTAMARIAGDAPP